MSLSPPVGAVLAPPRLRTAAAAHRSAPAFSVTIPPRTELCSDHDSDDYAEMGEGVPLGSWPARDGEGEEGDRNRAPMPLSRIVAMSAYQVGATFNAFLCLIVVVPSQIAAIAGDARKGEAVGLVLGSSGVLSLAAAPLIGTLSDLVPWTSSFGRRMPLLVGGSVVTALATALMLHSESITEYALLYAAVTAGTLLSSVRAPPISRCPHRALRVTSPCVFSRRCRSTA